MQFVLDDQGGTHPSSTAEQSARVTNPGEPRELVHSANQNGGRSVVQVLVHHRHGEHSVELALRPGAEKLERTSVCANSVGGRLGVSARHDLGAAPRTSF